MAGQDDGDVVAISSHEAKVLDRRDRGSERLAMGRQRRLEVAIGSSRLAAGPLAL